MISGPDDLYAILADEAADEIARLREEKAALLGVLRALVHGLSQPGRERTRDALRVQYEAAISAIAKERGK